MKKDLYSRKFIGSYFLFGGIAAAAYLTTAISFIMHSDYNDAWWLYGGNVLFMLVIFIYIFTSRRLFNTLGAMHKAAAGFFATFSGILLSVIVLSVLALTTKNPSLRQMPANTVQDQDSGLLGMVFLNAVMGNFAAGAFISLVIAYSTQRTKGKEEPGEM
jgi:hypothetical protein